MNPEDRAEVAGEHLHALTDSDQITDTQATAAAHLAGLCQNLATSIDTLRARGLIADGGVELVEEGCNCDHLPEGSFCVDCRDVLDASQPDSNGGARA